MVVRHNLPDCAIGEQSYEAELIVGYIRRLHHSGTDSYGCGFTFTNIAEGFRRAPLGVASEYGDLARRIDDALLEKVRADSRIPGSAASGAIIVHASSRTLALVVQDTDAEKAGQISLRPQPKGLAA